MAKPINENLLIWFPGFEASWAMYMYWCYSKFKNKVAFIMIN